MLYQVKIHSWWADRANDDAVQRNLTPPFHTDVWEGPVDLVPSDTVTGLLEQLFRLFNRVESGDELRLSGWGYRLPSLSVNDTVSLCHPVEQVWRRYRVEAFGWSDNLDE